MAGIAPASVGPATAEPAKNAEATAMALTRRTVLSLSTPSDERGFLAIHPPFGEADGKLPALNRSLPGDREALSLRVE
jgi:hypothetical protein